MSAIVGLSTNLLKSICTSDLNYLLTSSAQKALHENDLSEASPMDILGLLIGHLDPTLTSSFLKELDNTLIANTRILLLEGVNVNYNVINSLESVKAMINYLLPVYENSESVIYEKLTFCLEKADKMIAYINKYVMLNVEGDTPQDREYNVLRDFAKNSHTVKELSTIYTPAVARVYNFRLDAKKSYKYPNPKEDGAKSIKHSFVIPQDFRDLLDCDISLKYIAVIASLMEYDTAPNRLTLLHLFMSIERLNVNWLSQMLGISAEEARTIDLESMRVMMYNLILTVAMDTYTMNNPYNKDTLDIPVDHLRTSQDALSGYNLDTFVIHDKNMLELNNEILNTLVNWWRYYCSIYNKMSTVTTLKGISPELHLQFRYHEQKKKVKYPNGQILEETTFVPFDPMTKFKELVRFCYYLKTSDEFANLKAPSSQSCNLLINEMVLALAEGQYGDRKDVNYNNTVIKPADTIIRHLTSEVQSLKTVINAAVSLAVAEEDMDDATYHAFSSILPWVTIVETVLTTTDYSLVPQYTSEWAMCNTLGLDMNQICIDRNAMLYSKDIITKIYESNKYRIDVFDDKNLGVYDGMTIYSQSKAKEPETLYNYAIATTPDGEKIPNLEATHRYVATALREVKYVTDVLNKRLELITTYEDDYSTSDFKSIKEIYKSMMTTLIFQLDESSTVITDALTFHYGHSELNKNLREFKQRESRLEPIKIEQSRTKAMLEQTIDRHKNWYLKLEAREFMLSCLSSGNLSPDFMKIPVW